DNYFDTVRVELYKNGEFVKIIADSVISYTNNYLWNVDNSYQDGNDYKLKVVSFNNGIVGESKEDFEIKGETSVEGEVVSMNNVFPNPATDFISISQPLNLQFTTGFDKT